MPNKRATGSHSTVIRCPNCGEDYSITYKRCPFCDEKTVASARRRADDYEDPEVLDDDLGEDEDYEAPKSGGKRLAGGSPRRGGGYGGGSWSPLRVVGTVVSFAIIAAAAWIVITVVKPLVVKGEPVESPSVLSTPAVTPSQTPAADPAVDPTAGPDAGGLLPGETEPVPTAAPTDQIPSTQTATAFTLNREDFSLKGPGDSWNLKPKFTPAGSTGFLTWSVSKDGIVSVSEDGTVKALAKGTVTVTATMAGGYTQSCIVRVSSGSAPANSDPVTSAPPESSGSTGATITLNRSDFSFSHVGETFRMKVSGASSDPVWAIGDTGVATISGDGTVTAAGPGTTTITCTVDGQTLKCIVRCQF